MPATRFSGVVTAPISSRIASRCSRADSLAGIFNGKTQRVRTTQVMGSMMNVNGMPIIIQRAKLISTP